MRKIVLENGIVDPVKFYNSIAAQYNHHLHADISNNAVRNKVAGYFADLVKGKTVLDFGGGTGLDLPWLLKHNYEVYFCEPSSKMREIAVNLSNSELKNSKLNFLQDDRTDFVKWNGSTFAGPFDATLANFAVLNSIDNLELLFEKLSIVIKPGGHVVATLLDTTYKGIFKKYLKNFIIARLRNTRATLITQYDSYKHCSYLYTPDSVRRAAKDFDCKKNERIGETGFMLLHLQRR